MRRWSVEAPEANAYPAHAGGYMPNPDKGHRESGSADMRGWDSARPEGAASEPMGSRFDSGHRHFKQRFSDGPNLVDELDLEEPASGRASPASASEMGRCCVALRRAICSALPCLSRCVGA